MMRLLVVIDKSPDSTFAVDQALSMASAMSDAEIIFVFAEPLQANWQEGRRPKVGTGATFILKRTEARASLHGVKCRSRHERGDLAKIVARVAEEELCDLIVTTEGCMGPLARAVMKVTGFCAPTALKELIEIAPVPVTVVSSHRTPSLQPEETRPGA